METKKYWAVWDRYEHHDSIVDVFESKTGARECRKHLEAIERIGNDERRLYVAPMTVFPYFDAARYEPVPKKVLFEWGEFGSITIEPMELNSTEKITVRTVFFTDHGFVNEYGFIFILKYVPGFYYLDYYNKGMKKVRRYANKLLDMKMLDPLQNADPISLLNAGFKPTRDCEQWEVARKELTGKRFEAVYGAVKEMERIMGKEIINYTFCKEI